MSDDRARAHPVVIDRSMSSIRRPGSARRITLAAAGLAAAALVAVATLGGARPEPGTARSVSPSIDTVTGATPPSAVAATPAPTVDQEPAPTPDLPAYAEIAYGPCGYAVTPVVINGPVITEPTGVELIYGAGAEIDLDTGLTRTPLVDLAATERVTQMLELEGSIYLLTGSCTDSLTTEPRMLRIDSDGTVVDLRIAVAEGERVSRAFLVSGTVQLLISDQDWAIVGLQPLVGGPLIALPDGFSPWLARDGRLIGSAPTSDGLQRRVVSVEVSTGELDAVPGLSAFGSQYWMVAIDRSRVVGLTEDGHLQVHNFDTGTTVTRPWDLPTGFHGALISPDGTYLFGTTTGARGSTDGATELSDHGLLDLRTGTFSVIPGMRGLDAGGSVRPLFTGSADNRLVFAATEADGLHLFTYRPGDTDLTQSPRVLPDLVTQGYWEMLVRQPG